jgi:hypothetical protein
MAAVVRKWAVAGLLASLVRHAASLVPPAGLGDPTNWRRMPHAATPPFELAAAAAARPRRLILTSSASGLEVPSTRAAFERMVAARRAERRVVEGKARIAFILTAALAPSGSARASADDAPQPDSDAAAVAPPAQSGDGADASLARAPAKRRSAGELRRRRLTSARKKAAALCASLGPSFAVGELVDLQALHEDETARHDRGRARALAAPPLAYGGLAPVLPPAFEDADAAARARLAAVRDACAARLLKALDGCDCVWVVGGNTFALRHWMAQAGLDAVLLRLVGHAGLPYVGQSAGAIVAGVSAHTALWKGWDDPAAAPPPSGLEPPPPDGALLDALVAGTPPQVVLAADRGPAAAAWPLHRLASVGLVPFSIFPHFSDEWAPLCGRLQRTELRRAAAVAAALGVAADVAEGAAAAAAGGGGGDSGDGDGAGARQALLVLRDGESFVWDVAQPEFHRRVLRAHGE